MNDRIGMALLFCWGLLCLLTFLFWFVPFLTGPFHRLTRRVMIFGFAFLIIGKWLGFVKWDPKAPIDTRPPYGTGLYSTPSASPRPHGVHRIAWRHDK